MNTRSGGQWQISGLNAQHRQRIRKSLPKMILRLSRARQLDH